MTKLTNNSEHLSIPIHSENISFGAKLEHIKQKNAELRIRRFTVRNGSLERTELSKDSDIENQPSKSKFLVLDGGMRELLFQRGNIPTRDADVRCLIEDGDEDKIILAHQAYIEAGADIITTINSGIDVVSVEEIIEFTSTCGRLAKQAADSVTNKKILVAGALPPLVERHRPDLILDYEKGVEQYKIIVQALDQYSDFFLAESMTCLNEAIQAINAVSETSTKHIAISFCLLEDGTLPSGEDPGMVVKELHEKYPVEGVLFSCSTPEAIEKAFEKLTLAQAWPDDIMLIGAYPDRLSSHDNNSCKMREDLTEEKFKQIIDGWVEKYPQLKIIGGCCGMDPSHIHAIAN